MISSTTTLSWERSNSTRLQNTILKWIFPSSESAVTIDLEVQLDQLESVYSLRDSRTVKHFLRNNPELLTPLWTTTSCIDKYFGDNAWASLKVVTDPEVDNWENLFVVIHTSLPIEDSLDQLEKLVDEYYNSLDSDALQSNATLVFDLEFI